MTSSPHFVGPAASAFPASPDRSGCSAPNSREGPKFPPGAMCSGIRHVRRGAGVQRITKRELFPSPTSCTRPPYPGFSLYSCVSICCWNYSPVFNTFHSLSCPCLPLFPRGQFLSFILLVLAWNTAHSLRWPKSTRQSLGPIFCSVTGGKPFLQAPPNQTRGSPWSQCRPGSNQNFLGSASTVILIVGHCPRGSALQHFNWVFWEMHSGFLVVSTLDCLEAQGQQMSHLQC